MERSALIGLGEHILCDSERLGRGDSFDSSLPEGVSRNRLVDLPIPSVGVVNWLEWDQFSWVGRKIGRVLFLLFRKFVAVLELV